MRGSEETIKFQTSLEPPNVRAVPERCTNSTIAIQWEPIRGAEFYKIVISELDEEIVVENEIAEIENLPSGTSFRIEVVAIPYMSTRKKSKLFYERFFELNFRILFWYF